MSGLIDRDLAIMNAKEIHFRSNIKEYSALDEVIAMLYQMQEAESEIIHCRDCKNWDTTWQNDYAPNYHYCPMIDGTRRSDFYCADAERRTDERLNQQKSIVRLRTESK